MLVGDVPDWPQDTYATASEGEIQCQIFPQGEKRVRLYTTTATDQRRRYDGGLVGRTRFLGHFGGMRCMPLTEHLAGLCDRVNLLPGAQMRAFVDIDSLVRPVYGHHKRATRCRTCRLSYVDRRLAVLIM